MKSKIDQISLAELESAARKRSSVGDVDIFSGGLVRRYFDSPEITFLR
jgi:hypothetical protein